MYQSGTLKYKTKSLTIVLFCNEIPFLRNCQTGKNRITVKSNWKSDCGLIRIYPVSVNVSLRYMCALWLVECTECADAAQSTNHTLFFSQTCSDTAGSAQVTTLRCSSGRSITVIRDDLQTINDWKCDCQCDLCSVTARKWII